MAGFRPGRGTPYESALQPWHWLPPNSSMRGPIAALLLLALSSSRAGFPCALCEAGYDSCGFCLNRIAHTECPASDALDVMANCTEVAVGKMCEADGECGTSTVLNNCENMNWEGVRTAPPFSPLCCTPRRSHPRRSHPTPTPLSEQASRITTCTAASLATTWCPRVRSALRAARVGAASSPCPSASVQAPWSRPSASTISRRSRRATWPRRACCARRMASAAPRTPRTTASTPRVRAASTWTSTAAYPADPRRPHRRRRRRHGRRRRRRRRPPRRHPLGLLCLLSPRLRRRLRQD